MNRPLTALVHLWLIGDAQGPSCSFEVTVFLSSAQSPCFSSVAVAWLQYVRSAY